MRGAFGLALVVAHLVGGIGISQAQEFRIGEWRALALYGPPGLQEKTQYVSFTGHHGLQSDWLPNQSDLTAYVEGDVPLLSRFQLRVISLGMPLPGLLGTPMAGRIDDAILYSLTRTGYDVASRANNHALDLGSEGVLYYEKKLESAGLHIIGERRFPVFHWQTASKRIDICALADVSDRPDPDDLILMMDDAGFALVKRATEGADFRIAFAHLGSASRFPSPHERQQVAKLLSAGFGLVVSTGSHFIKGFVLEKGGPVAYGIGDHLLSIQYSGHPDTEPLGMHLVAGFQDARLVQVFVVPFHSDVRGRRLGRLEEASFAEFVRTLRKRSVSGEGTYYSDGTAFQMMLRGMRNMSPTDLRKLRPRHFIYGARFVIRQRPEWVVGAGVFGVAAVVLYRRRASRRRTKTSPASDSGKR